MTFEIFLYGLLGGVLVGGFFWVVGSVLDVWAERRRDRRLMEALCEMVARDDDGDDGA